MAQEMAIQVDPISIGVCGGGPIGQHSGRGDGRRHIDQAVKIQIEPIAVTSDKAADLLGLATRTFFDVRPELMARGMLCHRGRYDVKSLRQAWEKLCRDKMDE